MKITILALGSRGDVHPHIALGMGLQDAGYEVRIATHTIFETLVLSSGLAFLPVRSNPIELHRSQYFQKVCESDNVGIHTILNYYREQKMFMLEMFHDVWDACRSTDVILQSLFCYYIGSQIAEKLNVPAISVFVQPMYPTPAFPVVYLQRNLGSILNRLSWFIDEINSWLPYRSMVNKLRKEVLNLPPIPLFINHISQWRKKQKLIIFGISPTVVPKPKDWGDHIHITGYWFLDCTSNWQPTADLVDFLSAGPQPVYIGFGSMTTRKTKETTDKILRALKRTKQRGLIATGWGGLEGTNLPDYVFQVESVPHDWLFPQMAVVVHHGGAGTTASGLRAGIPSIVVPFALDQPFWGERIASLGVGPDPIPFRRLSVERLENAITVGVNDKEMRGRAAKLGERIRSEEGVTSAVELIHRYLSSL